MRRRLLAISAAVSALAFGAPIAVAGDPAFDCTFESIQQEDATGQNYEVLGWGYVAHAGGPVSIACGGISVITVS